MKKTYTLLFFFVLVAFSACKKEDNSPANKIVGKWLVQKIVSSTFNAGGFDDYHSTVEFGATDNAYFLFNKDKTGQAYFDATGKPQINKFTYDASQISKITVIPDGSNDGWDYQVTNVDENQIILTHDKPLSNQSQAKNREEIYLIKK